VVHDVEKVRLEPEPPSFAEDRELLLNREVPSQKPRRAEDVPSLIARTVKKLVEYRNTEFPLPTDIAGTSERIKGSPRPDIGAL
jgi:hypothetical protein